MTVMIPAMSSSSLQTVEPCDHEIVPNGDVVLVLQNPNAPFAVWNDPAGPASASAEDESPYSASPLRFLVSSHHLKSASSVFCAALTGPWMESACTKDGRHEITTEDWDVEALLVVLNIVHGRNNRVPKTVTLELLCKISVVVDYYHLSEAVRFPGWFWIDGLRASVPKTYDRELVLWLCVSWVFQDDTIFRAVTETAIRESPESVSALQLPISTEVIHKVNERREKALEGMKATFEFVSIGFIDGLWGCSYECQSITLGTLTKNMAAQGILKDRTGPYFQGMSVSKAVQAVEDIRPLDIEWRPKSGSWHECRVSLREHMNVVATRGRNGVKPLELDNFKGTAG
jgi:hypothetical protein